jgi:hypothetical protein
MAAYLASVVMFANLAGALAERIVESGLGA